MSGDSPNAHRNEIFDFRDRDGRTSPTPTTSKDVAVQSTGSVVQASVLVEPSKEKDDENYDLNSPVLNNSTRESKNGDQDNTIALEDLSFAGKDTDKDKDRKGDDKKRNGDADMPDAVLIPKGIKQLSNQKEEDENCLVKCLYVGITCCECTIM